MTNMNNFNADRFQFIADDEELFDNAVSLFEDLMKQFIGTGIYIGKTHY